MKGTKIRVTRFSDLYRVDVFDGLGQLLTSRLFSCMNNRAAIDRVFSLAESLNLKAPALIMI